MPICGTKGINVLENHCYDTVSWEQIPKYYCYHEKPFIFKRKKLEFKLHAGYITKNYLLLLQTFHTISKVIHVQLVNEYTLKIYLLSTSWGIKISPLSVFL